MLFSVPTWLNNHAYSGVPRRIHPLAPARLPHGFAFLRFFSRTGQQFRGQIIPSATVLVVGVGRTEAKVEGLFSEVCRLDYKGNVLDSMGGEVLKGGCALSRGV